MSNKKWQMSQIFMAFSEYLNFTTNPKLCTCICMSKISIRVFSRSGELYLPSAQYRNCGAVEVQYPWWCFLSYIKREATTFYGIPRCTLSFMQLRKLVTHVMEENQWFQFGGNRVLHFLEKINDNRIIVLNSQEKHRITKNSNENIASILYWCNNCAGLLRFCCNKNCEGTLWLNLIDCLMIVIMCLILWENWN